MIESIDTILPQTYDVFIAQRRNAHERLSTRTAFADKALVIKEYARYIKERKDLDDTMSIRRETIHFLERGILPENVVSIQVDDEVIKLPDRKMPVQKNLSQRTINFQDISAISAILTDIVGSKPLPGKAPLAVSTFPVEFVDSLLKQQPVAAKK